MTERTYLYGYNRNNPWGAATRRTRAQIEGVGEWADMNAEVMRRYFALADYCMDHEHELGFGDGVRYDSEQDAEFRRRHHTIPCPGGIKYAGLCWQLNSNASPYAPPGYSWHEPDASDDGALAIDGLGDHAYATLHCQRFGLVNGISNEAWHYQPLEISRGRPLNYVVHNLAVWPLPGQPPGDDMSYIPEPTPRRLFDSRGLGGKVQPGQIIPFDINRSGVAALINFTVTESDGPGFLVAWGAGVAIPETSNVTYDHAGQTISGMAAVPLDGELIRFTVGANATHVIVDLFGIFV